MPPIVLQHVLEMLVPPTETELQEVVVEVPPCIDTAEVLVTTLFVPPTLVPLVVQPIQEILVPVVVLVEDAIEVEVGVELPP